MNDCKHNWKESRFVARQAKRNEYMFTCTRCNEYRYVVSNNVSPGSTVVHSRTTDPTATTQADEKTECSVQAQATC